MTSPTRRAAWPAICRLTLWMLAAWLLLSTAAPWFARALNEMRLFGFPAGYWMVAQGALLSFIVLTVVFVLLVERIESRGAGAGQDESPPAGAAQPPELK